MLKYQIISLPYLFLLFSCAVQSYPSGGPRDIEGPHIIKVEPVNGSKNVKRNSIIKIFYDEMIDPSIVKSSIKIYPETEVNIKCHGNKIEIKPNDKWPNEIFRVVCSRSIKDFNANISDSSRVFVYSNSETIQKNKIYGTISNYDSTSYNSIGLFEYNIGLDSLILKYSIENDYQGKFVFSNIKNGEYLLITSNSIIKNIYDDIRNNNYSLSSELITINNNNSLDNKLYMYNPAERLDIKSFNMITPYYGNIELTNGKKIDFISNSYESEYFIDENDTVLRLDLTSANDSIDLELSLTNNVETYQVKRKMKNNIVEFDEIDPTIINYEISSEKIELFFSEPIKINKKNNEIFYIIPEIDIADSTLKSIDSINTNITEIEKSPLSFKIINPMKVEIIKDINILNIINIKNHFITDLSDNILADSTLDIGNYVLKNNFADGGDVYGNIFSDGDNDVIVEMTNSNVSYQVKTFDGNFHFVNVKPGIYQMWAYEDINNLNDNYFNGTLKPLKYSAKFDIYENNIEIRSKWDVEGIILNLR